jgi:hypothetical protein
VGAAVLGGGGYYQAGQLSSLSDDVIDAAQACAGRTGEVAVFNRSSPRVRPGVPVSFPVAWDELDRVVPADFTIRTAARMLGEGDPWTVRMPFARSLSFELIEEGRAIPVARVQAMHEGKRRTWARRG